LVQATVTCWRPSILNTLSPLSLMRAFLLVLALFTPESCHALRESSRGYAGEAYVFMIYGGESHRVGLMTAIYNVRQFDQDRPIVVLTPESSAGMERDLGKLSATVLIRPLIPSEACEGKAGVGKGRLEASFFKMHVWNLTQFSTVLYLESDMLIRESLDPIFKRARGMAGKEPIMIAPRGAMTCPTGDFQAAENHNVWNTGIMAIRPSEHFAQAYLDYVAAMNKGSVLLKCEGGSQALENVLFARVTQKRGASELFCLPPRYNCKDISCVADAAVVHWTGEHKPWDGAKNFEYYLPDWEKMRREASESTGVRFSRRLGPLDQADATFMKMASQLSHCHEAVLDLIRQSQ